ncbi:MAG: noncanonical pyrimidine nucleotidase, YjjG family [Saprospirales bacterium]|nr:noncanonical pyrimidine nucleotidase, YjjG family [Saprospirales bacterium]MBK8492102.1 noncanonical pyrimidine nucleotidase, YjjG family [Saprospirales bacterium]
MTYQWLIFDADNTLLDFTRSARIAFTETLRSIDLEPDGAFFEVYHQINVECWGDLEAGRISPEELKILRFSRFLDYLGKEGNPGEMNAYYFDVLKRSTFRVDGALDLLEALRPLGIPMAIATNGLAEVQRPRLEQAGIDHFFEEIIVSEEIGYFKPNPGFFHTTAERLRVQESDRILMIGDSLHSDIEGAQRAGWDTCWYNPNGDSHSLASSPSFIISRLHQLMEILT